MAIVALGHHAAWQHRGDLSQCRDLLGIEGHQRRRPAIAGQDRGGTADEPVVAVEPALQLDNERGATSHQVAQFRERHHAIGRGLEADALEVGEGPLVEPTGAFGQPAERIVVMHHGLAIGGDPEIAFDPVSPCDRCCERRRRILDHAISGVMQTSVRHGMRDQPVQCGHRQCLGQATSNTPSTSTAASAGSAATPTVVRAWRPLSPRTATNRSDAPFITFGPSRKAGSELMNPPRPDHLLDIVELAERRLDLGQQVDRTGARRLLAILDRYASTELALGNQFAVGIEANLARYEQQRADPNEGDVVCDRTCGRRERDSEVDKLFLSRSGHAASPFDALRSVSIYRGCLCRSDAFMQAAGCLVTSVSAQVAGGVLPLYVALQAGDAEAKKR